MSAITTSSLTRSRGVTLIEVLVTLSVVGIGLLGALALQMSAVNSNQQAVLRSQALVLTQSLAERMRTNRRLVNDDTAINPYSQLSNFSCPTAFDPLGAGNCAGATCTAAEIALIDIQQLTCQAQAIHPDLRIAVECTAPVSGETPFDSPSCPEFALYRLSTSWPNEIWQTPKGTTNPIDERCPEDALFNASSTEKRDCVVTELQLGVAL